MRTLALVVPPRAFRTGLGALLDLCLLANRYTAALYGEVEATRAVKARLLSLDGAPVAAADGRLIPVDGALARGPACDAVFIAPFDAEDGSAAVAQAAEMGELGAWIAEQYAGGAHVAASGAAIFVLAAAGLLSGGRSAPPWRMEREFRRRHPNVSLEPGPAVVAWGRLLTSGATAAEPELALRLLQAALSPNLGDVLGKLTRIGEAPVSLAADSGVSPEPRDPLVGKAQYALQQNFSHRVSLESLAAELGVSPRTLLRRFRAATGMGPLEYLQHVRIESAKQMLAKSSRPIERIGYMVGYADSGFFKDVFRRSVGLTPAEFRRASRARGGG